MVKQKICLTNYYTISNSTSILQAGDKFKQIYFEPYKAYKIVGF